MSKNNFPENTLVYINQSTISTIKSELAIYLNCFIFGQIMPALNSPPDIASYQCKQNQVKIAVPTYNLSSGKFLELNLGLGYIVLKGDPEEIFFGDGFNPETSKLLCSSSKEILGNVFTSTAFRKHCKKIIDERYTRKSSDIFFSFLLELLEKNP